MAEIQKCAAAPCGTRDCDSVSLLSLCTYRPWVAARSNQWKGTHMEASMEARKQREQDFHDDAFARNVREGVWKYHAITVRSRQRYTDLISKLGLRK